MKIKSGKYTLVLLFAFFIWSSAFSQKDINGVSKKSQIPDPVQLSDSLFKIERLNDKTIIISMGYDAVAAIATQKGIVVIDAGISTGLTSKYRKIIEKEFRRNDIAYLINTHGHPDHTGGNNIFAGAVIIGHENSLNEISDQRKDPEKLKTYLHKIIDDYDTELQSLVPGTDGWNDIFCQKIRYQYAYNDVLNNIPVTVPNLTFNDSLDIDMGDVTLNLIYFGKAHSGSDIIIHIPELKLLMVGDLFSKYGRPGIIDDNKKYSDKWVQAIDWIENRWAEIDLVIGGHGQILSKEDLLKFISYVKAESVQELTRKIDSLMQRYYLNGVFNGTVLVAKRGKIVCKKLLVTQIGDFKNSIACYKKGLEILYRYPEENYLKVAKNDAEQALVYIKTMEDKIKDE
jgi:glyoxylase-like metal-dependent hydrolase (beta-lactamase superfamily II)